MKQQNKRNYPNSTGYYHNCTFNFSRNSNIHLNRRKWNIKKSTTSRRKNTTSSSKRKIRTTIISLTN